MRHFIRNTTMRAARRMMNRFVILGTDSLILSLFLHVSPALAQIVPFGLENDTIVALVGERTDYQPDGYGFIQGMSLFAGTRTNGVYRMPAHASTSIWTSIGLSGKTITTMTVQHWGVGPRDGLHIFAATNPVATDSSARIFRHEEPLFGPADTTWESADSGLNTWLVRSMAAYYYTGHTPPQPVLAGLAYGGVYRSDAGGIFWENHAQDPSDRISAIDVHPLWFGMLAWAVGQTGCFPGAFRSTDAGNTWEYVGNGSSGYCLLIHPRNPDTVFVGEGSFLKTTTDGGISWSYRALSPRRINIRALIADPQFPENLFAGGSDSTGAFILFASRDGGRIWTEIHAPTDRRVGGISSFFFVSADSVYPRKERRSILYIGTDGTGVWKLDQQLLLGTEHLPGPPSSIDIQVYPHPLRNTGTVMFSLAGTGHVRLAVFDMLGREIMILTEGMKDPGGNSILIDARSLPSGVYRLALFFNNGTVIRPLRIVR